ncbi:MAG: glycoside hydrolase family 13 [Chloroflexaceae bacterium]|nr:glycoside hydrolase family 13 [Chloroflexaceae bacterium]
MLTKEPGHSGTVRVTFSLPGFRAESIHVVGDFNNWAPGAAPLCPCEHGWCIGMELPVGCAYRYRYLVDGSRWLNDWNADGYVPNSYGGDDSVVVTLLPHEMEGVEVLCPYDGQPCPYALQVVDKGQTRFG